MVEIRIDVNNKFLLVLLCSPFFPLPRPRLAAISFLLVSIYNPYEREGRKLIGFPLARPLFPFRSPPRSISPSCFTPSSRFNDLVSPLDYSRTDSRQTSTAKDCTRTVRHRNDEREKETPIGTCLIQTTLDDRHLLLLELTRT